MKILFLILCLFFAPLAHADMIPEKVSYDVVQTDGKFEIRQYPQQAFATVTVTAKDDDTAIKQGFDRLLKYLDGGNREQVKIPLTLPLMQTYTGTESAATWEARCVLPARYLTEAAPLMLDTDIQTGTVLTSRWAVVRFSGAPTPNNIRDHEDKLRNWVMFKAKKGFTDQPRYAFFSPPWLPPFLQHNEVMLPLID